MPLRTCPHFKFLMSHYRKELRGAPKSAGP